MNLEASLKRLLAIFALSLLAATSSKAQSLSAFEVQREVHEGLTSNPVFSGVQYGKMDRGDGTFCRKERTWSFAWRAELQDAEVVLRENAIDVSMLFVRSAIQATGYRTGGILCTPMGGTSQAKVDDFRVNFTIHKMKDYQNGSKPLIHLDALALKGLKIDGVGLDFTYFEISDASAPDWMNEFVEENLNVLMAAVLASSLSSRIDAKLSDVLAKWIEENEGGLGPDSELGSIP